MRTHLRHLWEVLTTGYWFVPACMSAGSAILAFGLLALDRHRVVQAWNIGWIYSGGAGGASTLLSTVAGSVITVAGVAFSITIATLSQASNQFGPRLLRNFMRDTGNQVVLGTFVSTFLYCLLILRSIHGETNRGASFVPHGSVTVAVVMAIASIAVLIYFIHHISVSLQAPAVVSSAASELAQGLRAMDASQRGAATPLKGHETPFAGHPEGMTVCSTGEGYLQAINTEQLMALALRENLVLQLSHRPGDYVMRGSVLMRVSPPEKCTPALAGKLNATHIFGHEPTPEQDVEFAFRQLVEIAVRALSPGINDPFTALNCLDTLGAALCRVSRHGLTGPHRYDGCGNLRIVCPVTSFSGLADVCFNQIRQYGHGSVPVVIRMLEVIAGCVEQVTSAGQRDILMDHARRIRSQAMAQIADSTDRRDVQARFDEVIRASTLRAQAVPTAAPNAT